MSVRFPGVLIPFLVLAPLARADQVVKPTPGTHEQEFLHGSVKRTYRIRVPPGYDGSRAVPLLLAFHGGGGRSVAAERGLGFNALADRHGFLAVYPQGVENHWNDGRESPRFPKPEQDDVDFITRLLDHLEKTYKIDPDRIFATGISNGGFFSHRLGADLSDRFAAIAPAAGTLGKNVVDRFAPKQPVHVLHLHGTADKAVPYDGGKVIANGGIAISVPDMIALWVKANGCDPTPKLEELPKRTDDPTRVRRTTYAAGPKGAEVVLLTLEGHGHNWPGRPALRPAAGPSTRELQAADVIREFFARHPKVRRTERDPSRP
jgi:polyhydroxybutyrate depolymerase